LERELLASDLVVDEAVWSLLCVELLFLCCCCNFF